MIILQMSSFNKELRDRVDRLEAELEEAEQQLIENAHAVKRELEEKMKAAWAEYRKSDRAKDVFDSTEQQMGQYTDSFVGTVWCSSEELDDPDTFAFCNSFGLTDLEARHYCQCCNEIRMSDA